MAEALQLELNTAYPARELMAWKGCQFRTREFETPAREHRFTTGECSSSTGSQ